MVDELATGKRRGLVWANRAGRFPNGAHGKLREAK